MKGPESPGATRRKTDHQAQGTGHIGYQELLVTFVREGFEGNLTIVVTDPDDEQVSVRSADSYLDSLSPP